jgi:hypothetical protein
MSRDDWHDVRCDREDSAPSFPTDRPPTRREVWARYHYIFFDRKGHKVTPSCKPTCLHTDEGELEGYCRGAWAWDYVSRFLFRGWDKQPDWVEGDPVIPAAVPSRDPHPFTPGNWGACMKTVYELLETASRKPA